jgi:hypothetical protein
MLGKTLGNSFVLAASLTALVVLSGCVTTLKCNNSGGLQDVAKTPWISIQSGPALNAGTTIQWSATDGDNGEIVLTKKLTTDPKDHVIVQGTAGQNYQCTAKVKP